MPVLKSPQKLNFISYWGRSVKTTVSTGLTSNKLKRKTWLSYEAWWQEDQLGCLVTQERKGKLEPTAWKTMGYPQVKLNVDILTTQQSHSQKQPRRNSNKKHTHRNFSSPIQTAKKLETTQTPAIGQWVDYLSHLSNRIKSSHSGDLPKVTKLHAGW